MAVTLMTLFLREASPLAGAALPQAAP